MKTASKIVTPDASHIDTYLEGFDVVPSDSVPHITLDSQRRFYVNTTARRLMDVVPYQRLAIAYNPSTRSLAVIKATAVDDPRMTAVLATSNYNVDKRFYMSARHFVGKYGYDDDAPYTFEYQHGKSDGSVFVFKLRE